MSQSATPPNGNIHRLNRLIYAGWEFQRKPFNPCLKAAKNKKLPAGFARECLNRWLRGHATTDTDNRWK